MNEHRLLGWLAFLMYTFVALVVLIEYIETGRVGTLIKVLDKVR